MQTSQIRIQARATPATGRLGWNRESFQGLLDMLPASALIVMDAGGAVDPTFPFGETWGNRLGRVTAEF